jgi:hypothetical protein
MVQRAIEGIDGHRGAEGRRRDIGLRGYRVSQRRTEAVDRTEGFRGASWLLGRRRVVEGTEGRRVDRGP